MQETVTAKLKVLETAEERERQAQSILKSLRQSLQLKDFDAAREFVYQLGAKHRGEALVLIRNALKKPKETCPECGEPLEFIFEDWSLQWRKNACLACQYQAVKKTIKRNCKEIMQRRGIAKRFLDASLEDFSESYRKQIKTDSGLYLYGPRGTGKTHLMAAMMRKEIIDTEPIPSRIMETDRISHYSEPIARYYPLFISVPELLLEIRGTWNHSRAETSEQEILDTYSSVKVLYLDDLGTEKATDWALQTLYLLIDRRYSEMLRTVISSNLSLDELADHLDDRISSRIAGMCEIIKMDGKDRRLSK